MKLPLHFQYNLCSISGFILSKIRLFIFILLASYYEDNHLKTMKHLQFENDSDKWAIIFSAFRLSKISRHLYSALQDHQTTNGGDLQKRTTPLAVSCGSNYCKWAPIKSANAYGVATSLFSRHDRKMRTISKYPILRPLMRLYPI